MTWVTRTHSRGLYLFLLCTLALLTFMFALTACGSSSNAQNVSSLGNSLSTASTTHHKQGATNGNGVTSVTNNQSSSTSTSNAQQSVQNMNQQVQNMLNQLDSANNDTQNSVNQAKQDTQQQP